MDTKDWRLDVEIQPKCLVSKLCGNSEKKYQYMKYKNPSNILTKISLTRYLNLKAFFETLEEI